MMDLQYDDCEGFEWDSANSVKNWTKHSVTPGECEQTFFNEPIVVSPDEKHSQKEARYFVLGKTDQDRRLFVVFTKRNGLIRVVSARDMNKKERVIYENFEKNA